MKNHRFSESTLGRGELVLLLFCLYVVSLAGCAARPSTGGGSTPSPTPDPNYKFMTGNWEFTAAPITNAAPFTKLAGFVNEQADEPSINDFTTAALQAISGTCLGDPPNISFTGSAQGSELSLSSFPTNAQIVTLIGTKDASSTVFTGNYKVAGGCADGSAGMITGTLYQPLSGNYKGTVTASIPVQSIELTLAQASQGDGEGKSYLSGNARLKNIPCFSSGTLLSGISYVLGSMAALTITTDDPDGPQLVAKGLFDAAADTINLTSIAFIQGSCSASYGQATLTKQ